MRCTKCEFENPAGMNFCGHCTEPLALICPRCRFQNPPGFKFCGQCTAALLGDAGITTAKSARAKSAAPVRVATKQVDASALEGERKMVTALFADIKGSTELEQDLDPEEARAIVDPALKLMIDAVRRYDGYVVQSTGDGIFAIFGAPVAHEDHPQRALYAALRMQEELKPLLRAAARARPATCRSKPRRREHWRSGGALDRNRRRQRRIHADRAHDQSRLADAGARADRLDRDQ